MPTAAPVPPDACDCHMHVFGPPERFPGSATRAYTPTVKSLAEYHAMADGLGLRRVVFVQPSAYGTDNRCMLEAMATAPQRYRGVAVIGPATTAADLAAMDRAGVRGVRLNLVTEGSPDVAAAHAALEKAVQRVGPLGWHVQIYAGVGLLGDLAPAIRRARVPVVLDHMAGTHDAAGLEQPGLSAILDLLADGEVWVKLSGADRVTRRSDGFSAAVPIARALIAANANNLVWGSDWPHLGEHHGPRGAHAPPAIYRDLDDAALLRVLRESVPDDAAWQAILVDNPGRLYGF